MRYNAEGKLEPACAESYEVSEDGLTYTFTMRDGLKWSNGDELDCKSLSIIRSNYIISSKPLCIIISCEYCAKVAVICSFLRICSSPPRPLEILCSKQL